MDSNGPFKYESVFCGPPMFGKLSLPGILQWVAYHRYHAGFDHFILYDSGAFTNDFRLAFDPLVDEGVVTVQDFREALQYDIWAQNQVSFCCPHPPVRLVSTPRGRGHCHCAGLSRGATGHLGAEPGWCFFSC